MAFNRNASFSMNLVDPDHTDVKQKITCALPVGDDLFIFTTTAIFRCLTAETLDPSRLHPETLHTYEKLYSIGTQKLMVARTIIQFEEMFKFLRPPLDQKKLLAQLWAATRHLLDCEKAVFYVYDRTMQLMPLCDQVITEGKIKGAMPAIPKILDLETYVNNFFFSSKLMLTVTFGFLHDFFGMPFDNKNCAHFDNHISWVTKKFGPKHPIPKMLASDANWIRLLSECSNAIRHPELGQTLEIRNMSFEPGNKFSAPSWRYDLTKKQLGAVAHHIDLLSDMDTYSKYLTCFLEEILLLSLDELFKKSDMLAIHARSDEELERDCPIKYFVGASKKFQQK